MLNSMRKAAFAMAALAAMVFNLPPAANADTTTRPSAFLKLHRHATRPRFRHPPI